MDMFEKAVRQKTRFKFKGLISVEDLWDLSLENLDSIYGDLDAALNSLPKKSLLSADTKQRDEIEFKQQIVKHIVETKQAEAEAAKLSKANSAKKQMILDIIAAKQNEQYHDMSIDDLKKLAESL